MWWKGGTAIFLTSIMIGRAAEAFDREKFIITRLRLKPGSKFLDTLTRMECKVDKGKESEYKVHLNVTRGSASS
jgi:hypothetical protein